MTICPTLLLHTRATVPTIAFTLAILISAFLPSKDFNGNNLFSIRTDGYCIWQLPLDRNNPPSLFSESDNLLIEKIFVSIACIS